jgi:hypothetical protein
MLRYVSLSIPAQVTMESPNHKINTGHGMGDAQQVIKRKTHGGICPLHFINAQNVKAEKPKKKKQTDTVYNAQH